MAITLRVKCCVNIASSQFNGVLGTIHKILSTNYVHTKKYCVCISGGVMSLNSKLAQHSYRAVNLCIYNPACIDIHKVLPSLHKHYSPTVTE